MKLRDARLEKNVPLVLACYATAMAVYPVSKYVNSPASNNAWCIWPVTWGCKCIRNRPPRLQFTSGDNALVPAGEGMIRRQDQQRPFFAWPGGQKWEAG